VVGKRLRDVTREVLTESCTRTVLPRAAAEAVAVKSLNALGVAFNRA
jgi:hypothetical protein